MNPAVAVRPLTADDWPAVEAIYAAGIATGNATFETEPPTWEQFDAGRASDLRLVAVDNHGTILGSAAAAGVSDRSVYAGVVEHSVYIDPHAQGHGVGRRLLNALVELCEDRGIWTVQSGILPENTASLALHEQCGFRVVGRRERIGAHHGRRRDVVFVERRSNTAGS